MAIETAEITIDFTANTDGCHRAAFRIQGSGDPYDTSNEVICAGIGACQIVITTTVNTTSCDGAITFEGYVQPCCEDVTSLAARTAWTQGYTPTVVCERYEISMIEGNLISVNIKDPGKLYEPANNIVITRQPGDTFVSPGDDAAADILTGGYGVTLGEGIINSITSLINGGASYTVADILTVGPTTGVGATIRVDAVDGLGAITFYSLILNGTEFVEGPFTFTGGTGVGADFEIVSVQDGGADFERYGAILDVNVTVPGRYSIDPVFTITTGTGLNGELNGKLEAPSGDWAGAGVDCAANPVTIADLTLGDIPYAICLDGGIAATPAGYSVTQTGCCINDDTTATACTTVEVENPTEVSLDIEITECGGTVSTVTIPANTTNTYCLVLDGINISNQRQLIVTDTLISCT